MADIPKPGKIDPPFDPWRTPPGLDQVDPAIIAAVRQNLTQNPVPIPISQISGFQRVISGTVQGSSGSILRESPKGTFTPSRAGTGQYNIAFSKGMFQIAPSITVSYSSLSGGGAPNSRFVTYGNVTKDGFDAEVIGAAGSFADVDWSFSASGA